MDRELEEYFDNYNELFNRKGYSQLLQEIHNKIAVLNDVSSIKDDNDLFFRKGQIEAYRTVLALQDTVDAARSQAEDVEDI